MSTLLKVLGLVALCGWFLAGQVAAADKPKKYQLHADLTYAQRGGEQLTADVYVPQGRGPFPGVVVVHGGAWMTGTKSGRMASISRRLANSGYTAVAINYRLAPRHRFPAQIEDCKSAVRWMRSNAGTYTIDPQRIGGFGYSAGGHLVALLGTTGADDGLEGADATPDSPSTRLQAVVAGGAPCDFRLIPAKSTRLVYWLGGTRETMPDPYRLASPLVYISKDDPPAMFFHGQSDTLVPLASPRAMVSALSAAGVSAKLMTIPNSGHIAAFLDNTAAAAAIDFFDEHLKGPARPAASD